MNQQPCAAISTPQASGGIAVIRISGQGSIELSEHLFYPFSKTPVSEMKGYTCAYGQIRDGETLLDDGIITIFRAPHSYTGEDTVEISCHGGLYVSQRILELILKKGARPAEAGEFTKMAFLNGKMSLAQAESVMDVISANGEAALKNASQLREGAMFRQISEISDILKNQLAALEVWADYPDEDLPDAAPEHLEEKLSEIQQKLIKIQSGYHYGSILRNGVNTVICGEPNVGKSTLFNRLSGYERSIVTDIAGTTRDVVEEQIRIGDVVLRLSDTAGLRDTEDKVEQIGVEAAKNRVNQAELLLIVYDCSRPFSEQNLGLLETITNRNTIILLNKSDTAESVDTSVFSAYSIPVCVISAKNGEGIAEFSEILQNMLKKDNLQENIFLANSRQKVCIDRALSAIEEAISALHYGEFLDAVTVLIESALEELLSLTGEKVSDAVVDTIFSKFCVGK